MAEFSKEYYDREKINLESDFSIEEIYQKLKPNTSVSRLCKGLGELLIMDKDEECFI